MAIDFRAVAVMRIIPIPDPARRRRRERPMRDDARCFAPKWRDCRLLLFVTAAWAAASHDARARLGFLPVTGLISAQCNASPLHLFMKRRAARRLRQRFRHTALPTCLIIFPRAEGRH